jgi:hypothetical protein
VRTELHKAIRQLFKGNLDSETDTTSLNDGDGSRISIKWVGGGGRRGGKSVGKGVVCPLLFPGDGIKAYAQVVAEIARLEGTSPRTFILHYRKRTAIHTTRSRTSQGSFTLT